MSSISPNHNENATVHDQSAEVEHPIPVIEESLSVSSNFKKKRKYAALILIGKIISVPIFFAVLYFAYLFFSLPSISLQDLQTPPIKQSEILTSLKQAPDLLPKALVAAEDQRFYQHMGIDFKAIARALWINSKEGSLKEGGSTITQQLARMAYLSSEKKFSRKIQEMILSIKIDRNLSKDQILLAYLNRADFGGGAIGIKAAAQRFFQKDINDLSLAQILRLVAKLKATSRYAINSKASTERARWILQMMQSLKMLDKKQVQKTLDELLFPSPSVKPKV